MCRAHSGRISSRLERTFCAINLPHDCRELLRFVDESLEMVTALGYSDVHDFVKRGLGLDPMMVAWAMKGLASLKPDESVRFDRLKSALA